MNLEQRLISQIDEFIPDSELKWDRIEDIPDFPIGSFQELKQQIDENSFSLGVDFSASNRIAPWFYGSVRRAFFSFLVMFPFFVFIIVLISFFFLKDFWLLLGIIFGFLGFYLASPYNPFRKFLDFVGILLLILLCYTFWKVDFIRGCPR